MEFGPVEEAAETCPLSFAGIAESYERGEWKSLGVSPKVRQRYQQAARATMAKDKRVNIRIASRDLKAIQARAIEDGIPYQTLMSSVLHKFVTGKLMEKNNVENDAER
jgi:predicted DNA binding CopG/RHH family protein